MAWKPHGFRTPQWQKLYGEKWREERPQTYQSKRPDVWTPEIKAQQRQQYTAQQQSLAGQAQALQQAGTNAMVIGGQVVSWPKGGTPPPLAQWTQQARWDVPSTPGMGRTATGPGPYPSLAGTPRPTYQQPYSYGQPQMGQPTGFQTQLSYMLQQPQLQLGTFGTPAPQQPQFGGPQQPLPQPKPKYDWQQPQTTVQPTPQPQQQPQTGGLLPGQPLPPTAQFGYRQPYGYRGRQGLGQPYEPRFGGLSQYFNY